MHIELSFEDARALVCALRIDLNRLLQDKQPSPGIGTLRQKAIAHELDLKRRIEQAFALNSDTTTRP